MKPALNTWLAAEKAAITHFDSSQSDSLPFTVPSGDSTVHSSVPLAPVLPQAINGPINIMTLASPVGLIATALFADRTGVPIWFVAAGVTTLVCGGLTLALPAVRNCDRGETA